MFSKLTYGGATPSYQIHLVSVGCNNVRSGIDEVDMGGNDSVGVVFQGPARPERVSVDLGREVRRQVRGKAAVQAIKSVLFERHFSSMNQMLKFLITSLGHWYNDPGLSKTSVTTNRHHFLCW